MHLSNISRPPLPILPRMLGGRVDGSLVLRDSGVGGVMPAAASLSGTRGLVNNSIGSSGSCRKNM